MGLRLRIAGSLALVGVLFVSACGSDATESAPLITDGSPDTTEVVTTTTDSSPVTTEETSDTTVETAPAAAFDVNDAEALLDESLAACDASYFDGSASDPSVGGEFTGEVSSGVFRFVDGEGTELLVDVNTGLITGPEGSEGPLGGSYSFWCPPDVFVGTVAENVTTDEDAAFADASDFLFGTALPACNTYALATDGTEPFDGSDGDPTVRGEFTELVDSGHPGRPPLPLFVDAYGVELVVDASVGVVTGIDGEDGVMPRPYSFWCPPDVFVGTLDE